MAFVASSDEHGNEIMRVMLDSDPNNRTVACYKNIRINCGPRLLETPYGRYDHRFRFHKFAYATLFDGDVKDESRETMDTEADASDEDDGTGHDDEDGDGDGDGDGIEAPPNETAAWTTAEVNAHSSLLAEEEEEKGLTGSTASLNCSSDCPSDSLSNLSHHLPFHSWLAGKNEEQQQAAQERRTELELRNRHAEERAKLSQTTYQHWFDGKTSQLRRAKSDLSSQGTTNRNELVDEDMMAAEADRHLEAWERGKLEAIQAQRLRSEAQAAELQEAERQRQLLAAAAYDQWVDEAGGKPKPVPMGRGLDSLRGTISPHYNNPNEWQSLARPEQPDRQPQKMTPRLGPDYARIDRLAQPKKLSQKHIFKPEQPLDVPVRFGHYEGLQSGTRPQIMSTREALRADWEPLDRRPQSAKSQRHTTGMYVGDQQKKGEREQMNMAESYAMQARQPREQVIMTECYARPREASNESHSMHMRAHIESGDESDAMQARHQREQPHMSESNDKHTMQLREADKDHESGNGNLALSITIAHSHSTEPKSIQPWAAPAPTQAPQPKRSLRMEKLHNNIRMWLNDSYEDEEPMHGEHVSDQWLRAKQRAVRLKEYQLQSSMADDDYEAERRAKEDEASRCPFHGKMLPLPPQPRGPQRHHSRVSLKPSLNERMRDRSPSIGSIGSIGDRYDGAKDLEVKPKRQNQRKLKPWR